MKMKKKLNLILVTKRQIVMKDAATKAEFATKSIDVDLLKKVCTKKLGG